MLQIKVKLEKLDYIIYYPVDKNNPDYFEIRMLLNNVRDIYFIALFNCINIIINLND